MSRPLHLIGLDIEPDWIEPIPNRKLPRHRASPMISYPIQPPFSVSPPPRHQARRISPNPDPRQTFRSIAAPKMSSPAQRSTPVLARLTAV